MYVSDSLKTVSDKLLISGVSGIRARQKNTQILSKQTHTSVRNIVLGSLIKISTYVCFSFIIPLGTLMLYCLTLRIALLVSFIGFNVLNTVTQVIM
jgi:hypothetical protein